VGQVAVKRGGKRRQMLSSAGCIKENLTYFSDYVLLALLLRGKTLMERRLWNTGLGYHASWLSQRASGKPRKYPRTTRFAGGFLFF
jgi:hypothetical protein